MNARYPYKQHRDRNHITAFACRVIDLLCIRPRIARDLATALEYRSGSAPPPPPAFDYSNPAKVAAAHLHRLRRQGYVVKGKDTKWYPTELGILLQHNFLAEFGNWNMNGYS